MHTNLPNFYHFIDDLKINNIKNLNKKIALIYRNNKNKPDENSIIKFRNYCKRKRQKFLVSNYDDLVIKYNLDGIYLSAFNRKKNLKRLKKIHFIVVGSAHDLKEIRCKENQGAQLIFLAPMFKSKNSNRSLGLYRYNNLANLTQLPTIALGGVSQSNLKLLNMVKKKGFAAINFFKNNNFKYGKRLK